jgi:hypothetical protein
MEKWERLPLISYLLEFFLKWPTLGMGLLSAFVKGYYLTSLLAVAESPFDYPQHAYFPLTRVGAPKSNEYGLHQSWL